MNKEANSTVVEPVGSPYKRAVFERFFDSNGNKAAADIEADEINLNLLLDVPVTVSIEMGKSRLTIGHLLSLKPGSVIELDRLAGEPLDVLVNGTLIARGEVVVVNDRFGIRLTDVVSSSERLKKLA